MVKISNTFNIGNRDELTPERLLEIMEDMYTTLATALNQKPSVYCPTDSSGTAIAANAADDFVSVGDIHVDIDTKVINVATEHDTADTIVWTPI